MKIYAISDTHGNLPDVQDDCDVLIHAGDICPDFLNMGTNRSYVTRVSNDDSIWQQANWIRDELRPWLTRLHQRGIQVIATWGNHDFVGQQKALIPADLPWTLLVDETKVVRPLPTAGAAGLSMQEGVSVYGTPWVPNLPRWAFHLDEEGLELRAEHIPEGLDILVVHGPPYGVSDAVSASLHVGDQALLDRLNAMAQPPKVVVCGHIHEGYGIWDVSDRTVLYNVAHVNERYEPVHPPSLLYEVSR